MTRKPPIYVTGIDYSKGPDQNVAITGKVDSDGVLTVIWIDEYGIVPESIWKRYGGKTIDGEAVRVIPKNRRLGHE